jgi:phosphomannomutase
MDLPNSRGSGPRPERAAASVASWGGALAGYLEGSGTVLLARGVRPDTAPTTRILAGALQLQGVHVRELGPVPLPCLPANIRTLEADLGIYVAGGVPTADGSFVLCGPDGAELPEEALRRIAALLEGPARPFGGYAGTYRADPDALDRYLRAIFARVDSDAIRDARRTVVVDAGHGTAGLAASPLLAALGCRAFILDGAGESDPMSRGEFGPTDLVPLGHAVQDRGADLGVAFDPGCTRALFVDERGAPLPFGAALGMLARGQLARTPGGAIVATPAAAAYLEATIRPGDGRVRAVPPGQLRTGFGALSSSVVLFADDEGGIGWPEHLPLADGLLAMAQMLDVLGRARRPLSTLLAPSPASAPPLVAPHREGPAPRHGPSPVAGGPA